MSIIDSVFFLLIFLAFVFFAGKRMMTYMHVMQQEDYDNVRLVKWMSANSVFDKRLSAFLLLLSVALAGAYFSGVLDGIPSFFVSFPVFIAFVLSAHFEKDPRKNSKKALVMTQRVKRIFFPAYIIAIILALPMYFASSQPWVWIVLIQLLPFLLIAINVALKPHEKSIQAQFWQEAHNKVQALRPKVIAITGSYGKTSIKHILGHILKMHDSTLITPGSVNTPMGITRVIREELDSDHKYLVVEMGAYGPESIARLCALTPPDIGIISAIGHAHYERFKSLDTVAQAKYELAEAVLKTADGKTIIHERTLNFRPARAVKAKAPERFIVCGDSQESNNYSEASYLQPQDLFVHSIKQEDAGLIVKLAYNGEKYTLDVPLFGFHHGYNIAMAFAAAMELGISAEDIQASLVSLPQIRHRLEVRKQGDGTTVIDDAYNSNPIGFQSALNVLATLGKAERRERGRGRTILITPGMIELGGAHDEIHEQIGRAAGDVCDIAITVNGARIPSFNRGFKMSAPSKDLLNFDSFQAAQAWFIKNKQPGDIVLIENDLPDMYESLPKM